MFEIAIGLGLILGLLAGGSLRNVFRVQLRYAWLLFLAVLLRFGIEIAIRYEIGPAESLRFPLYIASFGLLAGVLWLNRWQPGLLVAGAGIAANGIAIAMNGGWMPVWGPALQLVGMSSSDLVAAFHRLLPEQLGLEFLLRAGPFGDLIPIPFPLITNVASIGDAFIAAGLGWFVFASLVAPAAEEETEKLEALQESEAADVTGQPRAAGLPAGPPEGAGGVLALPAQTPAQVIASTPAVTGSQQLPPGWARGPAAAPRGEFGGSVATTASILAGRGIVRPGARSLSPRAGLRDAAALSRPARSGATRLSVAGPGALEYAAVTAAPGGAVGIGEALPRRAVLPARLADHPYVRLALDARFSAMWLGQLISLLGDRLNQVALGVLVYSVTGSALDVGLTFFAATLPNLLFGPFAGTFVDRWDQKRVMVVSDLLRAGLVLLVPLAAQRDVHLVYPVVFAVTTVSIFFRPARSAVLPRIVRPEDLNAANGATWTAENIADIGGYAFAGVFVAFLGTALTIAFWFDAASYLISAALLASITIPPVAR